jgi:hypothetical protein
MITIPQQLIQVCILFGVILVIYLINSQDKKVVTKITLVKKYRGENLHFSKTFKGLFPTIDLIKFFNDPIEVVESFFDAQNEMLIIVAVDEGKDWSDEEYYQLHKEGWECESIMYLPLE